MRKAEGSVFIVDVGATGLAARCRLATRCVRTLPITRYLGTANSPRAPERRAHCARAGLSGLCNLPQHLMEPVLADVARERGAQLGFNTEPLSMRQSAEAVHSICRDRVSGETFEVVSARAMGADGDNGPVAKALNLQMDGRMGLGHAANGWLVAERAKYTAHHPRARCTGWACRAGSSVWAAPPVCACGRGLRGCCWLAATRPMASLT